MQDLRARAVATVGKLAALDELAARSVADLIGGEIMSIQQVTRFRREYLIAPEPMFSTATVVTGGQDDAWRLVVLVPAAALDLVVASLEPELMDAPYESRPWIVPPGAPGGGTEHRFHVPAGELIVRVGKTDHVVEILITTKRTVGSDQATLRTRRLGLSRPSGRGGR